MRIDSYKQPKSSFLSMQKDMGIITELCLKNKRLKKLLYYNTSDALNCPDLTDEESLNLFGKHIRIVPIKRIEPEVQSFIVISFLDFTTNDFNPKFRNNFINIDILCHIDQWHLKDYALRPYLIAAEIDTMLDNQKLTNLGELNFVCCTPFSIPGTDYEGLTLSYLAIHGEEDKKYMPNPVDEEQYIKDFNEMFNE